MPARCDISGPVALLELDNPERHNALNPELLEAIGAALDRIESDHEGPVLRIRGRGPSFCSGFDLDRIREDRDLLDHFLKELSSISRRLRRLRQIVVAEIRGSALAGGCAIASACDLVCVEAGARLGYPVHAIGLSPAVSLPTLLDLVGGGVATEFMLSGRIADGREALRIGLAHRLADSPEELAGMVDELCESLARKGWNALAVTKAWVNEIAGAERDGPFDRTLEASLETGRSDEATRMLEAWWNRPRGG